jgi:hypothetical protein
MNRCSNRPRILSFVILGIAATAACSSRSIIGDQQGTGGIAGTQGPSTGGTGGTWGSAGGAGTAGSAGNGAVCPPVSGTAATALPLAPPTEYATNRYASFVEVGDLNGDGKPDLVAANYFFSDQSGISAAAGRPGGDGGSLSVFLSQPGGTFAPPTHYELRDPPSSLAVGDLDGDGKADVVAVNRMGTNVFINDGTGALGPAEV